VAEIEAIVEPDGVRNDVRWESVTFICIHCLILAITASSVVSTKITLFQRTSGYPPNLGVGNSTNFIIKKLTTASAIEAATIMNI
jgi:hypothetical protein